MRAISGLPNRTRLALSDPSALTLSTKGTAMQVHDDHFPLYLIAWDDGFTLVSLARLGESLTLLRKRGVRVTSVTPEAAL